MSETTVGKSAVFSLQEPLSQSDLLYLAVSSGCTTDHPFMLNTLFPPTCHVFCCATLKRAGKAGSCPLNYSGRSLLTLLRIRVLTAQITVQYVTHRFEMRRVCWLTTFSRVNADRPEGTWCAALCVVCYGVGWAATLLNLLIYHTVASQQVLHSAACWLYVTEEFQPYWAFLSLMYVFLNSESTFESPATALGPG